ncbi:UNVERIFIED_ORG: molybdopterin molybdotransferase [Zoogloea ramigera]|uniref:Molybdenum cofactor guanylyltransferase n=1 Tax=Duganella zoogloeoides TaxID=75659 RepID=A0ABZ0Y0W6_9BURK|nr:gephyrin-like molybdotransferase Glp [Duganella zoogloeoides]WQH05667.1 molybdenum cofactor guanylyltransferase MobA [Duganella zoogloeoides]
MAPANAITGWILAGGRGTRMGRVDKGLQPLGDTTMAGHVLARLRPQVGAIAINANRNLTQYQALAGPDVAVVADHIGGFEGPLAGLQTALLYCSAHCTAQGDTALVLTAPCDSPFLPPDLAARLHAALVANDADVALAVTMETDPENANAAPYRQRHPVFSLIRANLLPQLEAWLATGARRMEGWYHTLSVAEVLFDDAAAFRNINTLEELQRHAPEATAATSAPMATGPKSATGTGTGAGSGSEAEAGAGVGAVTATGAGAGTGAGAAAGNGDDNNPLPVDQALRLIAARVAPVAETETVGLCAALDRVLATDIISPINVPAYDNSAMDGYALRGADLPNVESGAHPDAGAVTLTVAGIAYAGRAFAGKVEQGQCVRIMTGAAMPAGCDSVLPQELAAAIGSDSDSVTIAAGVIAPGANRRFAGEDLALGGVALAAGKVLRPADLGLVASLGIAEVTVRRRLRVAFFSTGDELRALGQPLDDGCVYDSNRYTLFGMLARLGCEVIDLGIVRDDPVALEAALRTACRDADAIITSGGVSEGAADYTRDIMALLGDVAFWKLAMRPGRPLAFGKVSDGDASAWLFGLPGNPVAVMVSFYLFARPALLRMMGATAVAARPLLLRARAATAMRKRPGRTEYQRGIVAPGPDGAPQVRLTGAQGSGILSSMTAANCIVVLAHGQGNVAAGDMVDILPFDGLI